MANRAERRRQARAMGKPAPVYNVSPIQKEYDRVMNEIKDESTERALVLTFTIPLMVMKKKYGFDDKRMKQYAEALTDEYQSFFDGHIHLKDYADQVAKLTGVHFEMTDQEDDHQLFHIIGR